ncbi:MAG: hypothetical protein KGZ69_14115 [Methylomonas sp.]|nr:hypothetical protein [Methylomonas sp.]
MDFPAGNPSLAYKYHLFTVGWQLKPNPQKPIRTNTALGYFKKKPNRVIVRFIASALQITALHFPAFQKGIGRSPQTKI